MPTQIPNTKEKIGCVIAYFTLGIWGLVWLLVSKTPSYFQKDFIRFHCYQSIFLGILYMFIPYGVSILFQLIIQIIDLIPGALLISQVLHVVHGSIQSLITLGGLALIVYCGIFCLYGKYTNIPWVSQVINRMLR